MLAGVGAPLASHDITQRADAMRRIASDAGRLLLERFQGHGVQSSSKADGSPVTEADLACERLIRDAIRREFPQDAQLGEEFGAQEGTSGYRWIIDPIDGTVSFAAGVPMFGTLLAVEAVHGDAPGCVAGICELPALRERVWASTGGGTWWERDGQPPLRTQVRRGAALEDALVVTTGWEYFRRAGAEAALSLLAARAGRIRGWTDCYGLALLCTGRCDAVVEPQMMPWDSAPFEVMVREADGVITDWPGNPGTWGGRPGMRWRSAVAAAPELHAQLTQLLRPHEPSA